MARHGFTQKTIRTIAARSGWKCANPECRSVTTGPHSDSEDSISIGVAAHICAASPEGPRYDNSQTEQQRKSAENGLWLCQTCSRFIDRDEVRYSVGLLQGWRLDSEQAALREIETGVSRANGQDQIWMVPYRENPHFVGREAFLTEIHKRLHDQKSAVVGQAIRGLGGIGKTETAVAYAYKYRTEYEAVIWIRADTVLEIESGFVKAYEWIWPDREAPKPEDAVSTVLRWLKENSGWLLIFDNADTPQLLSPYVPSGVTGHVLLTSRANVFRSLQITSPIELPCLEIDDAVRFLLVSTGRDEAGDEEKNAAVELAKELDGLPLALEQAASYIEQGASFADYLESFRRQPIPWLEEGSAESRGYPDSVATTWSLNFTAVESESPASAELLRFTAFLAPDEIPYELLIMGSTVLGTVLGEALAGAVDEPVKLNRLLNPLARYSLVRIAEHRTYSTHRLVQELTKHALGTDAHRRWFEQTVRAIIVALPIPESSNWWLYKRVTPHAAFVAQHIAEYVVEIPEGARVCSCLGSYLASQGQYQLAEPLLQQSCEIDRTALGEDHPEFAYSLNNLAWLYHTVGRYEEAEPLSLQSTDIRRTALGEDHPDFAISLNNLAELYRAMGRYEEAEPLSKRAVEITRTALGEDHPVFATGLNNLAALYRAMGRYEEVEPLLQQSLEIRHTALGEDHPEFADSLDNLALLYDSMGRYEEAGPLHKQSTEIYRTALGEDHPKFAVSLNNLAELYRAMGRYEEAEPLFKQALEITRTNLGEHHPDFATGLNNLAELYRAMGRYEEAEPLSLQSTDIRCTALGEDHPDFAISLNNLASLYNSMGRFEEAEPLLQQSLEIVRTALGEDHADVAIKLNNLAVMYNSMGRYEEAEPLLQQSLEKFVSLLGDAHPLTQTARQSYENLLREMGEKAQGRSDKD